MKARISSLAWGLKNGHARNAHSFFVKSVLKVMEKVFMMKAAQVKAIEES